MATKSFTLARGKAAADVVRGAGSTVATDTVQLLVDYTAMTRQDLVLALVELQQHVLEGQWPPN